MLNPITEQLSSDTLNAELDKSKLNYTKCFEWLSYFKETKAWPCSSAHFIKFWEMDYKGNCGN